MSSPVDITKILRKPGEGLLTVTTGSGEARKILAPLIGNTSDAGWPRLARARIKGKGPQIVALPSDAGGGICRGAAHGPLHLRAALYARHPGFASRDLGDLPCIPQLLEDSMLGASQLRASGRSLWGSAWKNSNPVSPLNLLKSLLEQGFSANPKAFRPLVIGGDHSTSWAVSQALKQSGLYEGLAILHFDAHTDLLEARYGVRHCFATWAAHAVLAMKPAARKNFVQLGLRVSGRSKSYWEKKYGLRQIWAKELGQTNPKEFAGELVREWRRRGCHRLYISFDVDALDPRFVASTGTPEANGLDPKWCREVIRVCATEMTLVAADVVELAPVLGSAAQGRRSSRIAATVAHELLRGLSRGL
jgi:arginase family enzyme